MDLRHYTGNTTWPAHMKDLMKCALIRPALPTQMKSACRAFRICHLMMSFIRSLINGRRRRCLYVSRTSITNQRRSGFGVSLTHLIRSKELEEQLDAAFLFYKKEVEQRRWYGFWHYGDVMHTYDPIRHMWRYDLGGYAWQNNELVPTLWLWQAFFRSGREDIFRMAEAMTRHTSETDSFHLGEYAGLGSRHIVVHWDADARKRGSAWPGFINSITI